MENIFDYGDFRLPRPKDKVVGTVVSVKEREILIDLHSITEGTMFIDHYGKNINSFIGEVKVGDEIECEVSKVVQGENTAIYLTRLNAVKEDALNKLIADKTEVIKVKVIKKVNKGY
ncbi:MAG: hypothetical protein ACRC5M_04190, partial [Anaeroplasmataceae bacterium]